MKGLWMVEGVQYNAENDPIPKYPMWWGGEYTITSHVG